MTQVRTIASAAAALSLAVATSAWGSCYTLYGPRNTVVYQSTEPPIDLSKPISSQLAVRYPGHHLVMVTDSIRCTPVRPEGAAAGRALDTLSGEAFLDAPLFRDASPMMSDGTISGTGAAGQRSGSLPVMNSSRGTPGADVSAPSARGTMRGGAIALPSGSR